MLRVVRPLLWGRLIGRRARSTRSAGLGGVGGVALTVVLLLRRGFLCGWGMKPWCVSGGLLFLQVIDEAPTAHVDVEAIAGEHALEVT